MKAPGWSRLNGPRSQREARPKGNPRRVTRLHLGDVLRVGRCECRLRFGLRDQGEFHRRKQRVSVSGHTSGNDSANGWDLSASRANQARALLRVHRELRRRGIGQGLLEVAGNVDAGPGFEAVNPGRGPR